ncbi:hypothetical protein KAR91_15000 [Candidatus Pacearchaeota archaeon]|nr:hypothetical protein [Candidatus Pacearchaeota archaeon]
MKDLKDMTKVELAEHYNNLLGNKTQAFVHPETDKVSDFKPVKTFASRDKGIERIERLQACMAADDSTDGDEESTHTSPAVAKAGSGATTQCKSIFEEHHGLGRGACLAKCEEAGINKSTAATQWQRFRKESGMAETEEKKPGKIAQIRAFCAENSHLERKEMCAKLIEDGFAKGTVQVQVGKWFKEQG